jgi:hypothetical protein
MLISQYNVYLTGEVYKDKLNRPRKEFTGSRYSLMRIIYKTEDELCGIKL